MKRAGLRLALVVALIGSFVVTNVTSASAEPVGTVTTFSSPSLALPYRIVTGPDGALWFANTNNNSIGRITTAGSVSNYTGPGISAPIGITAGPDGALWFTNYSGNSIGRITVGGSVSNFTGAGISLPSSITSGPDGALWFTNYSGNSIGRITVGGAVSSFSGIGISGPRIITTGPDGALWFTNLDGNSIGRITVGGTVSNFTGIGVSGPVGIAVGIDGALWFTNQNNNSIGRISVGGAISNFTAVSLNAPASITEGPDGTLWFTNFGGDSVGRIDTGGFITDYPVAPGSGPNGITMGPDRAVWFTNGNNNSIGRVAAMSVDTAGFAHATEGSPYVQTLAASGGVAPYTWSLASGSLPPGLSLTPDGILFGSSATLAGTYDFTVRASDAGPTGDAVRALQIIVDPRPPVSVTTSSVPDATAGAAYSFGLDAANGIAPYTWSLVGGSLPPGLSLSSAGGITGVPRQEGSFSFAVQASDSGPAADGIRMFSITVNSGIPLSFLGATTLPAGRYQQLYERQLSIGGGVAPYNVDVSALPPGMSLSGSGFLFGTPTQVGTFSIPVTVHDDAIPQGVATKTYSLTIQPPTTLTVLTTSLPAATRGVAYSKTLVAAGGTAPYKWKKLVKLPKGLKLAASTGAITGTPSLKKVPAGSYAIKVQVTDKAKPKHTTTATFTLVIH